MVEHNDGCHLGSGFGRLKEPVRAGTDTELLSMDRVVRIGYRFFTRLRRQVAGEGTGRGEESEQNEARDADPWQAWHGRRALERPSAFLGQSVGPRRGVSLIKSRR